MPFMPQCSKLPIHNSWQSLSIVYLLHYQHHRRHSIFLPRFLSPRTTEQTTMIDKRKKRATF
jgi:hypothetical protein